MAIYVHRYVLVCVRVLTKSNKIIYNYIRAIKSFPDFFWGGGGLTSVHYGGASLSNVKPFCSTSSGARTCLCRAAETSRRPSTGGQRWRKSRQLTFAGHQSAVFKYKLCLEPIPRLLNLQLQQRCSRLERFFKVEKIVPSNMSEQKIETHKITYVIGYFEHVGSCQHKLVAPMY
jgi:hypothetical protein